MASEALSNVVDVKEMRQPDLPEEWQRRCAETTARLKETEGELTMVQKRLTNMGALLETAAGQRTSKMSTLQADVAEERRLRKEAEDKLWAERRRCQDLEGMLSHEHRLRRDAEAAHHGPGELQKLRANLASEKKARAAAEALAKSVAAESRAPRLGTEESARKARKPQLVETAGTPAIHKAPVKATSTATCPVPREDLERLEVRSRILQAENAAMRMEAFQQRARLREQQELHHMAAEEMRIRQLECAGNESATVVKPHFWRPRGLPGTWRRQRFCSRSRRGPGKRSFPPWSRTCAPARCLPGFKSTFSVICPQEPSKSADGLAGADRR